MEVEVDLARVIVLKKLNLKMMTSLMLDFVLEEKLILYHLAVCLCICLTTILFKIDIQRAQFKLGNHTGNILCSSCYWYRVKPNNIRVGRSSNTWQPWNKSEHLVTPIYR